MRLVIMKPKPLVQGMDNATLQFTSQTQAISSAVKLWVDSTKTSEIALTDGAMTIPVANLPAEAWVELPYESPNLRDITITLTYNGKQDKVAATGIWAVQTDFKNQLTDTMWADAGKPLTDTFTNFYGGKFGIQYGAAPVNVQYAMGMEFRIIPTATGQNWDKWRVKFDVTRQIETNSWHLDAGVFKEFTGAGWKIYWPGRTSFTSSGPTGANIDEATDQAPGNNTDNDNTPQNDHLYSIDGPGFSPNNGSEAQVVRRMNFLEFVRVRFDNTTPSTNQIDGNEGSRCSNKIGWYVNLWAEKNTTGTAYQQRAGKPNEIKLGYTAILPKPTP